MSKRVAVWEIVANFSKAKKAAAEVRRELERLDRQVDETNAKSAASDKKAADASVKRTSTTRAAIVEANRLASAQNESAASTDKSTEAAKRNSSAQDTLNASLRQASEAFKRAKNAADSHAGSQQSVADSMSRVDRAARSQKSALLELEAAKQRLIAAESKHGASSDKYASALNSVQRKTLAVESATARYDSALRKATAALTPASSKSSLLASGISKIDNASKRAWSGITRFGMSLGGVSIKVGLIISAIAALIPMVSQLAAGVLSLIGPLSSLGGVLASVPQGLSVAAGAMGTFMAAFKGLGAALKAGTQAQTTAAQSAKDLAKAEQQGARQITSAKRAVKQAEEGLKQARQSAADSAKANIRAVKDAEQGLIQAQRGAINSQDSLTRARERAARNLDDMKRSIRDVDLAQRGAALSLEEAQQRLVEVNADPGTSSLERRAAALAVDQAKASLSDIEKERADLEKSNADSVQKGVEGSDEVVAAVENHRDALAGLKEAELALRDTRKQSKRDAVANAKAIKDAQQSIKDAQQGVKDAQASVAESTVGAAQATSDYNAELAKLSPEGRAFVALLLSMKGKLTELQHAAQRGLLPGLGESLTILANSPLFGLLVRGLESFGSIMGDTAKKGAEMLSSGPFTEMFGRLLTSNEKLLRMAGDALLNIVAALVYVMDGARPFTEWLAETTLGWTEFWKASAKAGAESGSIAAGLDKTRSTLEVLGGALSNLWGTFKNIGRAGSDLGNDLLKSFEKITASWEKWTGSTKGQNELKAWFDAAREPLHQFSELLGAITRTLFDMGITGSDSTSKISESMRTDLLPSLQKLFDSLNNSDLITKVVEALSAMADALTKIVESGGGTALGTFVDIVGKLADVISKLPTGVLTAIGMAIGAIAAIRFVAFASGLSTALGMIGKLAKSGLDQKLGNVAANATAAVAGGTAGGGARKAAKPSMMSRVAGAVTGRGSSTPAGGAHKAAGAGVGAKAASAASSAASGLGKLGKGAASAAGPVSALTAILSFLPGPVGQVAGVISQLSLVFMLLGPVISKVVDWFGPVLTRVIGAVGPIFSKVVGFIGGLISKAGGFLAKFILTVITWLGKLRLLLLANPWIALVAALIAVGVLIYRNLDKIKGWISKGVEAIKNFLSKAWDMEKWLLSPFAGIGDKISALWTTFKTLVKIGVDAVGKFLDKAWDVAKWILSPFSKVGETISTIWEGIKETFRKGVEGVKGFWDGLKDFWANPLASFANLVNKYLIDPLNSLLGAFGTSWKIPSIPVPSATPTAGPRTTGPKPPERAAFARGGQVPGFGNRDSVSADLMPGEFVLRRDAVRAIGLPALHAANEGYSYRGQKFATGGSVEPQKFGLGGMLKAVWGKITDTAKVLRKGAAWGLDLILKPLRAAMSTLLPDSTIGKLLEGGVNKLIDGATQLVGGSEFAPQSESDAPVAFATGGTVPALLTPGEFVFNREAVQRIGVQNLHKANRSGNRARFAVGGKVLSAADSSRKRKKKVVGDPPYDAPVQKFAVGGSVKKIKPAVNTKPAAKTNTAKSAAAKPSAQQPKGSGKKSGAKTNTAKSAAKKNAAKTTTTDATTLDGRTLLNWLRSVTGTGSPGKHKVAEDETIKDILNLYYDAPTDKEVSKFLEANKLLQTTKVIPGKEAVPGGPGEALKRALTFAQAQVGKAYSMENRMGPNSYDCSGMQSAVTNVLQGRPYNRPLFYTGNMSSVLPGLGFKPGIGDGDDYTIGWSIAGQIPGSSEGHTSGTLGSYNIESRSGGVVGGSSARGATDSLYRYRMHLPLASAPGAPGTPDKTIKEGKNYKLKDKLAAGIKVLIPGWVTGGKKWGETLSAFGVDADTLSGVTSSTLGEIKKLSDLQKDDFLMGFKKAKIAKAKQELSDSGKTDNGDGGEGGDGATPTTPAEPELTPLEKALARAQKTNTDLTTYQSSLLTLSNWGLQALVDDLLSQGITDESVALAHDAAKDYNAAKQINDTIAAKPKVTMEDMTAMLKLLSFLQAFTGNPGLRDVARSLGMSDYSTVMLFEKAISNGILSGVAGSKMSQLGTDIASFRSGTFYANTGGVVPGTGSTDTVPAMLTPGEFVLRKQAVRALGIENLTRLNGVQKLNAGGMVLSPSVTPTPTAVTSSVSAAALAAAGGVVYSTTYDIDIHNPVAEDGTRSMLKALQRQAALGGGRSVRGGFGNG